MVVIAFKGATTYHEVGANQTGVFLMNEKLFFLFFLMLTSAANTFAGWCPDQADFAIRYTFCDNNFSQTGSVTIGVSTFNGAFPECSADATPTGAWSYRPAGTEYMIYSSGVDWFFGWTAKAYAQCFDVDGGTTCDQANDHIGSDGKQYTWGWGPVDGVQQGACAFIPDPCTGTMPGCTIKSKGVMDVLIKGVSGNPIKEKWRKEATGENESLKPAPSK